MSDHDIFATPNTPSIDPAKDYYSELVGEGKKFADNQALARAKAESDAFIVTKNNETKLLRDELAALEAELTKRKNIEDFVEAQRRREPTYEEPSTQTAPTAQLALSPEALQKQIDQILSDRESKTSRDRNLIDVKEKLIDTFGEDYALKVRQIAQANGIPEDLINQTAATSPKALFAMLGLNQPRQEAPLAPPRGQSTFIPNTSTSKDWDYFENIRKTDRSRYLSAAVQLEMHKAAMSGAFNK